jgi:hypothetical protein
MLELMEKLMMVMILVMRKLVEMLGKKLRKSTIWREACPWTLISRVIPLLLLHLTWEVQVATTNSRI